jgi:integrase
VHDFRHTAASTHLRDNQHPKVVQELLGHSTFSLTMNTYSYLMPSMTLEAADRMDALFRGTRTAN